TYHSDWRALARLQTLKIRALADPLEVPNNLSFSYAREISPILHITLTYGMIFPLGLVGLVLSLPAWRRHLLWVLYGLATVASLMSTIILARFRLTLVPVLIIYAAAGLVWLWQSVRARRTTEIMTYVALLTGVAVTQHYVLPISALRELPSIAIYPQEYLIAASIYAQEGRFDRAVGEVERLRARAAERPSYQALAHDALLYDGIYRALWANQLLAQGKRDEARRQIERMENAYASHSEFASASYNLGVLYLKVGEPARAKSYLE